MTVDNPPFLSSADVARLLPLEECIAAVESAFRMHAEGTSGGMGVLSLPAKDGAFHIKAASLGKYFATKINGNFFFNAERFGLPRIQGTIVLADAENGKPLAILDSVEITIRRTGAATAVAAKCLARPDSHTLTIIGCGNQGRISLEAIRLVLHLERVFAFDSDPARAQRFATESGAEAVPDFRAALRESDLCVTCTPSRQAFLMKEDVPPGMFVAAVGADSHEKQEIEPDLLANASVFVDDLEQCATFGDLHHAIAAGVMTRNDVVATLGDVLSGRSRGRRSSEEIIIFDSTGTAIQDVAAAALIYEKLTS